MNLKSKNSKKFTLLILFSLTLSLLTLTSQNANVIKQDAIQEIMSLDLGISSSRNLLDDGIKDTNNITLYRMAALLKNVPNFFYYKFFDKNAHKFEKIYIDIQFKNYEKIMLDRTVALQ